MIPNCSARGPSTQVILVMRDPSPVSGPEQDTDTCARRPTHCPAHCPARSLEPLGRQEVEQMEQLLQVVLKGSPRQQQLVVDLVAIQDPEELSGEGRGSGARPPGQPGSGRSAPLPWTGCS